jgi:tetraacyldisaccharide 4'-kinase
MSAAFARTLQRLWWQPRLGLPAALLTPLALLVGAVAARRRAAARRKPPTPLPVPVIVVGNVIVGGAGKTPTVIALVDQLRAWGHRPGIVSRGHGRRDDAPLLLDAANAAGARALAFGDEPLLMHRRTGAPVAVARARREAAARLLAAHPEVDVLIADDGLQHHALARDIELIVFDGRGLGNGWTLPAGPLRERIETLWPAAHSASAAVPPDAGSGGARTPPRFVLVNGRWPAPPAHPLPTPLAANCWNAERELGGVVDLAGWARGEPASPAALDALRGRRILAAAGIGDPERFFGMLEARGLTIARLPLDDHARFDPLPWDAGIAEVIVTEKDAVKLAPHPPAGTRVWVVTLDFRLPPGLVQALQPALAAVLASRRNPR